MEDPPGDLESPKADGGGPEAGETQRNPKKEVSSMPDLVFHDWIDPLF